MMKRSLVVDANNILHRTFFARIKDVEEEILIGLCHHAALWSLQKYYKLYPADEIVMAFDSYSWRKLYTKNLDNCITYKKYKGNRRKDLTPKQELMFKHFDEHVNVFTEILRKETSLLVLKGDHLEADDLIAGYIQRNPDMAHVLISADKDYVQLIKKNNLTIIDPDSGKPRSLEDWNDDPDYFMFEKCLRGDTSDNVMSAYPFLRQKKIASAYTNEFEKQNIMNHEFTVLDNSGSDIVERKFLTSDVYDENHYLMSLEAQPEFIRNQIDKTIDSAYENRGKFNYFKFLKFCGENGLKNIASNIDNFVPLLNGKHARA